MKITCFSGADISAASVLAHLGGTLERMLFETAAAATFSARELLFYCYQSEYRD
jgi:hypothetical protein